MSIKCRRSKNRTGPDHRSHIRRATQRFSVCPAIGARRKQKWKQIKSWLATRCPAFPAKTVQQGKLVPEQPSRWYLKRPVLKSLPLRLLQIRQGALCQGEGFRKETSSSGARRQDATACTAKMSYKQMGRSSECAVVFCLARSAACQSVRHGSLSSRILTA